MHMADALVSPVVGGTMWATSAVLIGACSKHVTRHFDERKIPLMGVLGAFVFTAQMINFTIPTTGSSGHLGGGLLLAVLLGPTAAFLTMASVLVIQALFFADGGLLALGCNIFNLGFLPAFLAYPFIYRRIAGHNPKPGQLVMATVTAAVIGLQLGALGVVLETVASAVASIPFRPFLLLMQSIHLAIGIVEGLVTALVISFICRTRPGILACNRADSPTRDKALRPLLVPLLAATVLTGGILSWFASERPDGLEWSLAGSIGATELADGQDPAHEILAGIQNRTALLTGYALPVPEGDIPQGASLTEGKRFSKSLAGLAGGAVTLALCLLAGHLSRKRAFPGSGRRAG